MSRHHSSTKWQAEDEFIVLGKDNEEIEEADLISLDLVIRDS